MNTTIHIIEHLNWNLLMLNIMHIFTLVKKLITKILSLKLVIMLEYQNTKNIVAKGCTLNLSEKVLIGKIKILFHGGRLLMISMMKKSLDNFIKKNCKKTKKSKRI